MAIAKSFQCPACQDRYPIVAFVRGIEEDDFDEYDDVDWDAAFIKMDSGKRYLSLGDENFELSPFCNDCGMMIAISRKRQDERLGHGRIKTRRAKDGKYVDLESHQEYMYMMGEADPDVEFAMEGELDRNGEPLSFTDVDLAKLSYWRISRVLRDKGFNEIPWHELEDHAQNVSLTFLEKLKCAQCGKLCYIGRGTPCCDEAGPAEDINSLHAYHWVCCKGEARALMEEWVERRVAEIPQDVLDVARANNITDESLAMAWRNGAAESIDRHRRESPLWTRLDIGDLTVEFEKEGIQLTQRQVKTIRNAVLAHAGASRDGKKPDEIRRIIKEKIGDKAPAAYAILKRRIGRID